MATYKFIDADAMKAHHRATFLIPTAREKASICAGDYIKVGFVFDAATGRNERMWLRVNTVRGQRISGTLENDPVYVNAALGDDIQLELRHVLAIEHADVYTAAA